MHDNKMNKKGKNQYFGSAEKKEPIQKEQELIAQGQNVRSEVYIEGSKLSEKKPVQQEALHRRRRECKSRSGGGIGGATSR